MSQWVRAGLPAFGSGRVPSRRSASAPQTVHSQTSGTSASREKGIAESVPAGAVVGDALPRRHLDAGVGLVTLGTESRAAQCSLGHMSSS